MSPAQYRAAISALWPTQAAAAEFFDLNIKSINSRANGRQPIPAAEAKLLRLMLRLSALTDQRIVDD